MDPIIPVDKLPTYVQVLAALLTAMGAGKGSQIAFRRWGNGKAGATEPMTRTEFKEEISPLLAEQRKTTEAIDDLVTTTKTHQGWLQGFVEGQRGKG